MKLKQNVYLVFLFCFFSTIASAQKQEEDSTLLATSHYFYFKPLEVNIHKVYHPTYDQTYCHLPDALQQMDNSYYARMSNVGLSHLNLIYQPDNSLQFNYQPNSFGAYLFTPQNIHFFQLDKPYTELAYYGGLQQEFFFTAQHSQNVLKNWNIAIEDRLISSQGSYANSDVLNNYFNLNTHYFTKNGRYHIKGAFIYNRAKISENGGIAVDSLFTKDIQTNRSAIPVNLTSAQSGWREMNVFAQQNFFLQKPDTIQGKGSPFNLGTIGLLSQWHRQIRIYTDGNPASGFYDHIFKDSTFTHDSVSNWQLENTLFWSNDIYNNRLYNNPFRLTFGIKQKYTVVDDSVFNESFMLFSPVVALNIQIAGFALGFNGEYNLGDNSYGSNDLVLQANAAYNLKTKRFLHSFAATVEMSSKTPDYFYSRYNGNNFSWINRDFDNEQLQRLSAEYKLNNFFVLGGAVTNLKNAVYLDENIAPFQNTESAQLVQLYTVEKLRWKFLRFENYANLQSTNNDDVFRVPLLTLKTSLFAEFPLFKGVTTMQAGVDFNYNTSYYGDAYMPALASFYRQNEIETGNHVWLDVFVSARIKRAFLFVKFTHVNALFDSSPTYYMIPHYPTQDFGFKWGFIWKFFD